MAEFQDLEALTAEAAADLSSKRYHIMRLSGRLQTNQASDATGSSVFGVLQNAPKQGEAATLAYRGMSKVVAGGAISVNAIVTTNGSGRAAAVASGQMAVGRALEASGADGDQISVLLFPPVRWAGAG